MRNAFAGFVRHGQDAIVAGFTEGIRRPYREGQRTYKCQTGERHEAVSQAKRGGEQGQGDEQPNQREVIYRRVDVFRPVQKTVQLFHKKKPRPKERGDLSEIGGQSPPQQLLFLNFGVLNHLHAVLLNDLALEGDGLRG